MTSSRTSLSLLALALALALLLLSSNPATAITCSDVNNDLRPCLKYLVNGSGKPPPACCAGASALKAAASTPADKKTACDCIKSAAKNFKLNAQLAQSLPANCGITLPFAVSPDVDCSKVG